MDILILFLLLVFFLFSLEYGKKDMFWGLATVFSGLLLSACVVVRFNEEISKCDNSLFELAH